MERTHIGWTVECINVAKTEIHIMILQAIPDLRYVFDKKRHRSLYLTTWGGPRAFEPVVSKSRAEHQESGCLLEMKRPSSPCNPLAGSAQFSLLFATCGTAR
jgi:hypothetical protein